MSRADLKIPKRQKEVMLWVHPSGPIVGCIFLCHTGERGDAQDPLDVMNHDQPFLVLKQEESGETYFYNKNSIVRVEYADRQAREPMTSVTLPCRLHMMDGSMIDGVIREALPPENSRLLDYMNIAEARFIKLHVDEHYRCLVNKSYIVRIVPRDEAEA